MRIILKAEEAKRFFGTRMPDKIVGKTFVPFPKEEIGRDPICEYRAVYGPVKEAKWIGNELQIEI